MQQQNNFLTRSMVQRYYASKYNSLQEKLNYILFQTSQCIFMHTKFIDVNDKRQKINKNFNPYTTFNISKLYFYIIIVLFPEV